MRITHCSRAHEHLAGFQSGALTNGAAVNILVHGVWWTRGVSVELDAELLAWITGFLKIFLYKLVFCLLAILAPQIKKKKKKGSPVPFCGWETEA